MVKKADNASKTDNASSEETLLATLLKSTEVIASLNATLASFQQEYAEGRRITREATLGVTSKLDNLDRTIGEMKLTAEQAEPRREDEMSRIFALLGDERKDRQALLAVGKDDREFIREIIREELGTRKQHGTWLAQSVQAVWKAGGQWIVLGVTILFVAWVLKLSGISLADALSLVK